MGSGSSFAPIDEVEANGRAVDEQLPAYPKNGWAASNSVSTAKKVFDSISSSSFDCCCDEFFLLHFFSSYVWEMEQDEKKKEKKGLVFSSLLGMNRVKEDDGR